MPEIRSLFWRGFTVGLFCVLATCFHYAFLSADQNEKQHGAFEFPEGFSLRDLKEVTDALIKTKRVLAPDTVIVLSIEVVNEKKLLVKVGLKDAPEGGYTSYLLHKDPAKKSWEVESGEAVIQ